MTTTGRGCATTVSWDIADLASDPELATVAGRIARVAEIDARLRRWCASRTADAAAEALQANGVPAGKVQDGGDLMADPQLRRPRLLAHDRPRRVRRAALRPLPGAVEHAPTWSRTCLSGAYIGEHNFEVYRDLAGMSDDDIAVGMGDGLFG